jgi:peptide/nickel transport system permease protein
MSSNKAFAADASRKERIKEWVSRPGGFGIITGATMFALISLVGFIYPLVGPYGADEFVGESLERPSLQHPMGLDQLGRDVMTRVFAAVPADIGIAFLGVTIPLVIGTIVGILLAISKNKYFVSIVDFLRSRTIQRGDYLDCDELGEICTYCSYKSGCSYAAELH